uniref:Craniofacial development protein 2-like n=1 Tax=Haemonchus contortus TaxID=6289 RepID=A0A7I4Z1Q9_HAECO
MVIGTSNARTIALEACIEGLKTQVRKPKYNVIGLTETKRYCPLHTVLETGEELFLVKCDSRGVSGVGVFVNTHLAMNTDLCSTLICAQRQPSTLKLNNPNRTLAIRKMWLDLSSHHLRCLRTNSKLQRRGVLGVLYGSGEDHRADHTFFKVTVGDFNAKIGPRRAAEELHIGTHGIEWNEQGEILFEFIMSTHTIHGNS